MDCLFFLKSATHPGDRRICPDYKWAFKYHRKFIDAKLGSFNGVDAYQKVLNFVEEYEAKCQNEENLPEGERYISIEEQENQIIIAIVDPFMRRVPSTSWCPRPVLRNAHFAIANDKVFFIGPESNHWQRLSLTD